MENLKTIGGRKFAFGTLPALTAIRVEVAIARVVGEPLFKALMGEKKGGTEDEKTEAAGIAAIGLLMKNMDADELLALMETVMEHVTCDGKRIEFNECFTGRPREPWEVLVAALRFNFQNFLPESLLDSVRKKIKV